MVNVKTLYSIIKDNSDELEIIVDLEDEDNISEDSE